MQEIKLLYTTFSKEDLECISENEAVFVMQVGGLIHEVMALQKLVHMSSHGVDNPVQRKAENAQATYFLRLLAGTLFEGWQLMAQKPDEYRMLIAKYKAQLDPIAKEALEKLQKYFSGKNSCERIRNNFSHHYNFGEILKMYRTWPKNDRLEIYFSEMHANCRYVASDVVTAFAIFETTDAERVGRELLALIKEILEIATAFIEVIAAYLSIIMMKVIEERKLQSQEITIEAPSLNDLRFHHFVARPEGKRAD
jgi:hypothetical protein